MWDGFWLLGSGKTWPKLPNDVKQVIGKHVETATMNERKDVFELNNSLEKALTEKGMVFNTVETAPFQAKLQSAGFYKEWKGKFGDDIWKLLEKATGASL